MKYEGPITYTKPEQSDTEVEFRHHRFEIKSDGVVVAAAEVNYISKPIPFYQLTNLYTEFEHQGRGYGSAVMDKVETFLKERGKPGVLVDSSVFTNSGSRSFYLDRGWVPIDTFGRFAYNLSEKIDPKIFVGYEMRNQEVESDNSERNRKQFLENS